MTGEAVHVGLLTVQLHLPGCRSLKQKRGTLKPLLTALRKNFNVSAAEVGAHDFHQSATIACAAVSNSSRHVQPLFEKIPRWIECHRPDVQLVDSEYIML